MNPGRLSPRLAVYLAGGALLVGLGVATGRGALVALGTPFVLAALAGAALRPVVATAEVALVDDQGRPRPSPIEVDEGTAVSLEVVVRGQPHQVVEVALARPVGVGVAGGPAVYAQRLDAHGVGRHRLAVRPDHWGRQPVGLGVVRSSDPLGLVVFDQVLDSPVRIRVRPRPETVRSAIRPGHLRPVGGSHPAAVAGAGIEFAGIRPYRPGDRARDLSRRPGSGRDELMVVERHPERSADVVVFVDSFAADGLGDSVRAAMALVDLQLAERDRVGLVVFGGSLRLIRPGSGRRQRRRVVEALLDVQPVFSWAEKSIEVIAPRMLPRGATVVVVSPLVDERTLAAVVDLRRRRHEVAVIEVSPWRWTPTALTPLDRQAQRLWELQRQARRDRLAAVGVGLARWDEGVELELLLARLGRGGRGGRGGARWGAA